MLAIATGLALFIGLLLGMLGGGGSVLLVPVLLYVLKLEPKSALASSQLVLATTSLVAIGVHVRAGRVVFPTGAVFGLAGMLGAYVGGRTAHYVPASVLLSGFVALMFISAFQMLGSRRLSAAGSAATESRSAGIPWRGAAVGLPTGFVAGLLGAGGGFLIVPALTLFGGLTIEKAVGTSLLVIMMQSLAGAAGYLGHAEVNFRVVTLLSGAMAMSSILGGLLSQRLPAARLRQMFAGLLLMMALFMLVKSVF